MNMDALYKLTHGVYVLGSRDGDRPDGSVVDAVMQVANKPWILALSCTNGSYTKHCIEMVREFSLSVLGKTTEPWVIANFGFRSSRTVDKWRSVKHYIQGGLPYLEDNIATMHCRVMQTITYGSNTLFLAEVVGCADTKSGEPLTYYDYRSYFKTEVIESFNKFQSAEKEEKMSEEVKNEEGKHWVCTVCGYIYDEETPFEELPDDWVCPLCGVDKSYFVYE